MNRWVREFRLIPIVLIAAGGLFALKAIGLVFDGGYTLGQRLASTDTLVVTTVPVAPTTTLRMPTTALEVAAAPSPGARQSWMQEMFGYPDVTGSVGASKPAAGDSAAKAQGAKDAPPAPGQPPETRPVVETVVPLNAPRPVSAAERAILERLQARRQELESRAREIDVRENLLKEAEQRLEARAADSKTAAKQDAQRKEEDGDAARFKNLVTMYETMKPKDAAKIFDRLDIRVLMEVASKINPRRMSEILAQMSPQAAERLTVEMASRAHGIERATNPADLPKIDGRPGG